MVQTVFQKLKKLLGLDGVLAADTAGKHSHKNCKNCADGNCQHDKDKECSEEECCCGGECRVDENGNKHDCKHCGKEDCDCGSEDGCDCGEHCAHCDHEH